MIKLICSDIDGTLVPDGTDKINPEIFPVIKELTKRGVQFVAASGRQYESMQKLFAPVKDEILFVADGGGATFENGELVTAVKLNKADLKELFSEAKKIPDAVTMAASPLTSYIPKGEPELYKLLDEGYHYDITVVDDIMDCLDADIIKVSIFEKTGYAEEKVHQYMDEKWFCHERLQAVCAGEVWMDFSSRKGGKGRAIADIQKGLGVTPEETMIFGDNINDLGMLALAKYSFAVGNARQEVKDATNYIADTNVNDGVLKELKNYLEGTGIFKNM